MPEEEYDPTEPVYLEIQPKISDPLRPRLSASSISTFRQCPRQWYIKYMVGMPTTAGYEAGVGNFIHELFEDLYTLPPDQRLPETAKKMAADRWEKFYDNMFDEMSDAEIIIPDEKELKIFTWDRIKTLWHIETPAEIEVVHNELKIDVDIEGVHLYGFVDRVETENNEIIISDYKTGKMGADSYLTDKLNQILLYGLAYQYQEKANAKYGRLIFLRDGIIEVKYTKETLDETLKFLLRNEKKIKQTIAGTADEAKPKTGPLCEWCPFIHLCDEGQAKFEERRNAGRSRLDAPAWKTLNIIPYAVDRADTPWGWAKYQIVNSK